MNRIIQQAFALLFLLTISLGVKSQQLQSITGSVINSQTEPINNAKLFILNTGLSATTDKKGQFKITRLLAAGSYQIEVSAAGYSSIIKAITIGNQQKPFVFTLLEDSRQLSEVLVTAQKETKIHRRRL